MSDLIPKYLVNYVNRQRASRADAVNAVLASLTGRERALTKDVAVMGYVQGLMRPREEGCPKDSLVFPLVIDACLTHPDLYPAINAHFEDHREIVEYFVQGQQPDGTWEQCSSTTTDPQFAAERLTARRQMHPESELRIARRTTTTVIEIAMEPTE